MDTKFNDGWFAAGVCGGLVFGLAIDDIAIGMALGTALGLSFAFASTKKK